MTTKRTSTPPHENTRTHRLEAIFNAITARAGNTTATDASAFAAAFYRRMAADDLALRGVDDWAALACEMLEFAHKRKPGTALVRIFNPGADNGWDSSHTVIQIINDDMPFLVDSVSMALAEDGISVHVLSHPLIAMARERSGKLTGVGSGNSESVMHLEIDRQTSEDMARLEHKLHGVLVNVRVIVRDWRVMRDKMQQVAADLATRPLPLADAGRREAQEFLRWAANDHFTFFGYREYQVRRHNGEDALVAVDGSGLGLLAQSEAKPRPLQSLAAHYSQHAGSARDALILTKTNARSRVHRPGYMDYIGVLSFDDQGRPTTEQRFIGLYTSSAYTSRPWDIPLVRERFEHVMSESGLNPTGHSGKTLRHILETLPRDELFQSSSAELARLGLGVLHLQERVRSKLFLRKDRYGRFYSVLVYVPRERFNTDVRQRIESILRKRMHAGQIDANVVIGESPLAQLHLLVRPHQGAEITVDEATLEAELAASVRNWLDALRDELIARHGENRGLELVNTFGRALPAGYIEQAGPALAATDVDYLAALSSPEQLLPNLVRAPHPRAGEGPLRLKLYRKHDDLPLSDVLPTMENMGLQVISEHPYRIELADEAVYIQDFEVETGVDDAVVDAASGRFSEAFARIWAGDAENDGFNTLILLAGLDWREVAMLRGYAKYLQQVGIPFSQHYIEQTFARYPAIVRLLVDTFAARFDPARQQREEEYTSAREMLKTELNQVASLDDDRILRAFMGVIDATLRTSFYQRAQDGGFKPTISYKFDSARVPDAPKPRPYREIFVCGPRTEGIHLRFGPVARGGLRWSDRREDFRTEVLGLVKAQMVKNTVIVPVGSKGGFIVKRPPVSGERDAVQAEGIACYKQFISGLLDITDNLQGDNVIAPLDVVRHDEDDPYLVVAADKGTASFSDIANGIAREYGFWLDDAFASGGSVGYDHKGMGITARGAWESVKRHFRALGRDSQNEDFTAVGIGDMSGDVFGNGMLLSKHIRLIAAFDHRHIFIDPAPDAAVSFNERQRLFKLPRSSWDDYDKKRISNGGGVWPRSAKSIPLSPQARDGLGLADDVTELAPNQLISAILKAPVDLLWNGGIGTYVKGSAETHAEVGDRGNNAIRIDGRELRCRVVGEGGNLGFTQRGRIEAALNGVNINTDFIDNSAGVDTSDHEVNIKILLGTQVAAGKLTLAARNKLLASMTDEVADLVLWDNYRQNQALSLMQRMAVKRLGSKQHFIRSLEAAGRLDRQIEFLPTDAELAERKARGQGLTRPELAVLLSYAKLVVFEQLLTSDVPEDAFLSKELQRYFPQPLQQKYAGAMESLRLKREIIATAVTNSMINRMGATFLLRMQEDSGRAPGEIAKAFAITRETLDARTLWSQIDALDGKVPESVQLDALEVIWALQRSFTRWLLARPGAIPDISTAVARYQSGFRDIRYAEGIIPDSLRPAYEASITAWQDKGVPDELGGQLAAMPYLEPACDIIELAGECGQPPIDVAKLHYRVGEALRVPWLVMQIDALAVDGRWHAVARAALREELAAQLRTLTRQVMDAPGADADAKVATWLEQGGPALRFTLSMLSELAAQKTLDYPTASVAVQRLSQLAQRG